MTEFETNGTSTGTPNSKIASKFSMVQAAMSSCTICNKRVYDMEKISIDQQLVFHKSCFRCSQCRGILTVRNYTMVDGELFCKQHYVRQFKEVGGKYNFTGQSTTPNRTVDIANLSIHTTSTSTHGSDGVDAPKPVRSWQPTRNDDKEDPPPASDSPRILASAAGVASIRSMFEIPRDGKDSQTNSSPSERRPGHGHAYVEGETAVISMMKTQSSVKARRAQFSGAGGATTEEHENETVQSTSSQRHQPRPVVEYESAEIVQTSHASHQHVDLEDERERDYEHHASNVHHDRAEEEEEEEQEENVDERRPVYDEDEQIYENEPQADDNGYNDNHGYHDNGYDDGAVYENQEADDNGYGHQYNDNSGAYDDDEHEQSYHQHDDDEEVVYEEVQ